ncbi:VQ protein [Dillenia turbinata]|uniref:VQ protein n=1 Tax=Dillenia turbinata TaxID=194707 RepID=A0AAN8Z7U8_9MAGN
MQSSSGGEEEYDSRADSSSSLSAFLHNTTNPTRRSHVGSLSHNLPQPPPHPPLPPPPLHHPHHMFDPLHSTNFLSLDNNNNNNMVIWPKNILVRSEFPSIIQTTGTDNNNNSNVNNSDLIPQVPDHHHHHHQLQPRTNSKKRSRASRRAPTTVLTTDTTNFRAMVQEFTGIPAPPFASSSISGFQRTRLVDLFGTRSTHLVDPCSPPPHYLLRPFAQKFQPPPSTTTTSSTAITTSSSSSLIDVNFQHPSNMQNPTLLTLQSLLQHPPPPAPPPRFSIPDNPPPPIIGSKSPGANLEIHSRVLDDFSPSHGGIVNTNLGGLLPNLVSPDVTRSIENNPRSWVSGGGSSDGGGGGGDQAHLRSINGNSVALIHSELRTAN